MNALVPTMDRPPVLAGATPQALVPTSFEGAWRIAQVLAASGMAPKDMSTPEKCVVAIMHGMELGLTPMAAVQSIAVVNGRPSLWGDSVIGLVRASGLLDSIEETVTGDGDQRVATCIVKRKGDAKSITSTFSVADAKKAGLWGKSGPWQQYPDRMLRMRARAFALRDGFADVLRGLAIREEMEDVAATARDVTPPP
ncbi:MAG TPA: recombinase RecT, partial [Beijerinckiaceae bacterium]|nr:recombinase RecT [Beijerinckiaceae bacterium]